MLRASSPLSSRSRRASAKIRGLVGPRVLAIVLLGYLATTKVGAFLYNLGYSYLAPALMIFFSWRSDSKLNLAIGIIWLGHFGWDRFFAYGLKYDSNFKDTHLGDLNRKM